MAFKRATKKQSKLRCAIFGPAGSGKTMSGLRIATGVGGRIAVIDTEHGSASKYADRWQFDSDELTDKTIDGYIRSINEAARGGYEVLFIDSLSHGWQELLEQVDKLANAKYRGNTWSAWSEGTPKQKALVQSLLSYPGHVIATMRSKTEWTQEQTNGGKARPVRVGLAPEQGKGIEYEFDLLLELNIEHVANVIKDRTGKFQDKLIEKPGEELGKQLAAWLNEGAPAKEPEPTQAPKTIEPPPEKTNTAEFADFERVVREEFLNGKPKHEARNVADGIKIFVVESEMAAGLGIKNWDDVKACSNPEFFAAQIDLLRDRAMQEEREPAAVA